MAEHNIHTSAKVPPLRFKEFKGEWKRTKVGDDCEVQMCKRILAEQTQPEGEVPFYKIGTIGGQPNAYISKQLFDLYKEKYSYPHKGEILISCAGTVGKCVKFDGKDSYYQDSNIVWLRHDESKYTNEFLYYILSRQNWRKLNTTTIVRIYNDDLRSLSFNYPSKDEQNKISHLLNLLDERIATQNAQIEKLKSLISGLAKHFARQDRPNVRLCECLECHSSSLKESEVKSTGNYPVYGASGIVGFLDDYQIDEDAILIIKDGSGVGTTFFATGKYSVIGTLNYLTAKEDVSLKYIYYALKSFNFEPYRIGMAIPHIYFKDYSKGKVFCPVLPEQEQIARGLFCIEEKLKCEEEYLTLLKNQRTYLLRNMFV